MKIIKICFFVFVALFILQTKTTYATDYNYLPPDVLIKQNEEKSALEYRLRNLEDGLSGSSSSYISNLTSRISQLESEWTTEKNYISGTYAQYGIANQLAGKLAEIDAKYNSQINDLKSEKAKLETSVSNQQSKEKEISDLKLEIAKLKAEMVNQELQVNLQALEKYQTKEVYSDADVLEVFKYLDALAVQDSSDLYQIVKENNLDVAQRVAILYDKRYPNGKPGTAKYDDYLASIKPIAKPTAIQKTTTPESTQIEEIKEEAILEQVIATPPTTQESVITPPVQEKQSLGRKVINFFKRFFW
jgi:hypothetical protein